MLEPTERGFERYAEITDSYGASVSVQESSAATGPHVWVFINGGELSRGTGVNDGSSHLTTQQAKELRDALTEFLDRVPDRWGPGN
jgi:hypothetical protein